jgi:transposase-like protein
VKPQVIADVSGEFVYHTGEVAMKRETFTKLSAACNAALMPEPQRLVFTPPNVAKRREISYPHVDENDKTKPSPVSVGRSGGDRGQRRELPARQAAAVELLVAGRTVCAVARHLGVSRRSVFRWKNDPRFNAAVAERVKELGRSLGTERARRASAPVRPAARVAESSAPTPEERREMERLFARAGITPSWKKAGARRGSDRVASRNVPECHIPRTLET